MPRVCAESKALDLVTLSLSGLDLSTLFVGEQIGGFLFEPHSWPPRPVSKDEVVSFGGFPGLWRDQVRRREFDFSSFSVAGSRVASLGDGYFVIQLEREFWIKSFDYDNREDPHRLGGLSGAPVFSERQTPQRVAVFDLVGIAYQFSEQYDLLYAARAELIGAQGGLPEA